MYIQNNIVYYLIPIFQYRSVENTYVGPVFEKWKKRNTNFLKTKIKNSNSSFFLFNGIQKLHENILGLVTYQKFWATK